MLRRRRFAQRCVCGGCFGQRRAAACSAASLAADDASLRCQLWHRRVPPASVGGGSKLSKCVESGAATCSSKRPSVLGLSAASAYGEALSCLRHASERPTHSGRDRVASELCICVSHRCISAARAQPYRGVPASTHPYRSVHGLDAAATLHDEATFRTRSGGGGGPHHARADDGVLPQRPEGRRRIRRALRRY